VNKRAITALSFGFGISLSLSGTSCDQMCPAGQQDCGDSESSAGSSGSAGATEAGATGYHADTCGALTALKKCMTAFCATTTNPFCTCYKRNYDLTTNGCVCVDFDAKDYCAKAKARGDDGRNYDCAAASSGVSSYCVTVK
jgi:hypothetical protein